MRKAFVLICVFAGLLASTTAAQHDHSAQDQKAPASAPAGAPQQKPAEMDHSHHGDAAPATPAQPDPRPDFFRGQKYSEFSHRLAGVFVFLAGLFYLMSEPIAKRWPVARYAWSLCLLLPGIYLMIFSDPRWVFGSQTFSELVRSSAEFRQHKIYATILITLGLFEFARTRGAIRGTWSAMVFPALGLAGAFLLLFHEHGGQHSADHMAVMQKIQGQHLMFTIVGCGIAVGKGLSEITWGLRRVFLRAWPTLMLVLGLMLMFYSE